MDNSLNTSFSSTQTQTRSLVAQILAREAITVTHDPSMPSAAFDLKNRTLILPCWDTAKVGEHAKPVYDFLVGHEVGHAKHTPADGWKKTSEDIGGTDPRSQKVAADFLNVVEDARIEKMIKREFPGLRKDFTVGYETLAKMDIFGIKGRDIATLRFIDRLNLHFKLGIHTDLQVPFHNDVERAFVERIDGVISFDDAAKVAADLYAYEQEKKRDAESEEGEGNAGGGSGKERKRDGKGKGKDGTEQGKDEQQGKDGSEEGNGADGEDQDGDAGNGTEEGSEGEQKTKGKGKDQGEEQGNQDGTGKEQEQETPENNTGAGADANARGGAKYNPVPEGSETQDALEDFKRKMSKTDLNKNMRECVLRVADIDPSKVVIQPLDFVNLVNENLHYYTNKVSAGRDADAVKTQNLALACFDASTRRQRGAVDAMVKRFETRRAARDASRTGSCKSGRISMRSLTKYKFSEDIFDRIVIKRDEKNHGIVILLDWSGSMGQILQSAAEQVCGIVQFCRRVGIPAEVYVFSTMHVPCADKWLRDDILAGKAGSLMNGEPVETRHSIQRWGSCAKYDSQNEAYRFTDHVCNLPEGTAAKGNHAVYQPFSLFKVYDAKMDLRKFQNTFGRILLLSQVIGSMKDADIFRDGYHNITPIVMDPISLGNTPLDESIVAMRSIVENFRKSSNTKVTLVSMSDGDGTSLAFYHKRKSPEHPGKRILVDGRTGRRYTDSNNFNDNGSTQLPVVQMFRDTTDAAIVGIMMTTHCGSRETGASGTGTSTYYRWILSNPKCKTGAYGKDYEEIRNNDNKQFKENGWLALDLAPYNMYFIIGMRRDREVEYDQNKERKRLENLKNRKVALTREFILKSEADQTNRAFINRLMDIVA